MLSKSTYIFTTLILFHKHGFFFISIQEINLRMKGRKLKVIFFSQNRLVL